MKCTNVITKELLDNINIGDTVYVNDWEPNEGLKVIGMSENYVLMADLDNYDYSILEKKIRLTESHNRMEKGKFHCGPDDRIFGWLSKDAGRYSEQYEFTSPEWIAEYLNAFETGACKLSERNGIALRRLKISQGS